ncbi:MAG: hypothetical protein KIH09_14175, partial [Candidatus Freyarchaeota archaeon]|nr:hypothetical protein [Candidatus Jordarchaeia archaeon]
MSSFVSRVLFATTMDQKPSPKTSENMRLETGATGFNQLRNRRNKDTNHSKHISKTEKSASPLL